MQQEPPELPASQKRIRMQLSADMITQLREHAERTGVGAMRLLKGARDKPPGLSADMIGNWMRMVVVTANPEHFRYVLARWAALPTNRRRELTPTMLFQLNTELRRTGMGPVLILKKAVGRPDGLTWQVIQQWVGGDVNTVAEAHWDYVIDRLRQLPDESSPRSYRAARLTRKEISSADLVELRQHRERTGIGGAVLLRGATDKPEGLTPATISAWLTGRVSVAVPEHFAYVLGRYRAWP